VTLDATERNPFDESDFEFYRSRSYRDRELDRREAQDTAADKDTELSIEMQARFDERAQLRRERLFRHYEASIEGGFDEQNRAMEERRG
jgi:hypothetical protein